MICAGDSSLFYMEDIEKKMKQIYPDACDVGYIYSEEEIPVFKSHLKTLRDIYKHTHITWGDKRNGGWTVDMFIDFEEDEGRIYGEQVSISCCWDIPRKVKFVEVHTKRTSRTVSGYKR